tara:strand:+ start:1791 stop:2501 length:711 start_codon:yes stop_codon:yes gene_type:complete
MKTNKINKEIKGTLGISFLRNLYSVMGNQTIPCVEKRGGEDMIQHIRNLTSGESETPVTIAFVADDRSIIRKVDTAVKKGLVMSRGFLIELCDDSQKWMNDADNYRNASSYDFNLARRFIFQCLDICSYIRETNTNILELNHDSADEEVYSFFTRRYYSNFTHIKELLPILSSRYSVDSFSKLVKTNYYSYLSESHKLKSKFDIRVDSTMFSRKLIGSEINIVRNEVHDKLEEIVL